MALKTSLFELWTNQKNCKEIVLQSIHLYKNIGARTLARAAHANSHLALKTQKSLKIGLEDKIFCMRARGSARTPKFFFGFKKLIKFSTFYIPWMFS